MINKTIGKSHDDRWVRKLICVFFPIIQSKEVILRTELIENPCVQLLVKSLKATLPFYIILGSCKGNKKNTRIDYIWTSTNIFQEINDVTIKKIDDKILTDHKILIFSFVNQGLLTTKPNIKSYRNKKIIFDYNKTEDKKKDDFKESLIKASVEWDTSWSIEEKWSYYRKNLEMKKMNL